MSPTPPINSNQFHPIASSHGLQGVPTTSLLDAFGVAGIIPLQASTASPVSLVAPQVAPAAGRVPPRLSENYIQNDIYRLCGTFSVESTTADERAAITATVIGYVQTCHAMPHLEPALYRMIFSCGTDALMRDYSGPHFSDKI